MKPIPVLGALLASLAFVSPAYADSPSTTVFGGAVACTTQTTAGATLGQRWCEGDGNPHNISTASSFDGTPIDVEAAFPAAPATGPDGNYPVVAIFHGYGGSKLLASDTSASSTAQRWLQQGYAVFSMTDRGFWGSCGVYVPAPSPGAAKPAPCDKGYVHLMSNAYEVHDAQYFLGLLADEGVINPNAIGANGGSYGGGLSMQLATLNNRTQLTDGTLVPWTSTGGLAMHIAAAAPEYAWSDLIGALQPNGSTLDYAAENPYLGPGGDRRFGIAKAYWNGALYVGGSNPSLGGAPGYYAPSSGPGFPDPAADINGWYAANSTGGPYDGTTASQQQMAEFVNHAALDIDSSVAPAPMLITNGWNDDLFGVDEGVKMYNRIRDLHPTTPVSLYEINYGHPPRAGNPPINDVGQMYLAQGAWFAKYLKGSTSAPVSDPVGGVSISTSACGPSGSPVPGANYHAKNWASLAQGEIHVDGAAAQTIAPGTSPAYSFQNPPTTSPASVGDTVCTTAASADTSGAAVYATSAAPSGGYTIAGSPTVIADLGVVGANDQVIGRLYDVDPSSSTERLIARSIYRPTGVGSTTRQVFQLHPQAWQVVAGHTLKLELLSSDAPYARPATGQNPVTVSNLQLRVPTIEAPGAADGQVVAQAAKVLPTGYVLARDLLTPAATPTPTPTAATPTPTPIPAPVKADPLTPAAARTALAKLPTKVKTTSKRTSVSFTDSIPEAGTVTYVLSLDVRKGKHSTRHKLGTMTRIVTASGTVSIKITVRASQRSLLKKHSSSKVLLTTTLKTAVLGDLLTTTRRFKVKG